MGMDKTIRRVTDPEEQDRETYLYWQRQPVGDRLTAVWDVSAAAYAFAAAFNGGADHDDQRHEGPLKRIQRKRC